MKLEVGQFVRNDNGIIGKIIGFKGDMIETDNKRLITYKSSHSECKIKEKLIDLIEVGDYLNGFKVSKIERYDTNTIIKIGNSTFNVLEGEKIYTPSYDNNNGYEKIEKLKSIVTKEQFEQMAYKVGE